jgi:hypothetical protein
MKWMRHRDALVEDTLAFVKSVKGEPTTRPSFSASQISEPALVNAPAQLRPSIGFKFARPSDREEIKQRVANFKAHQERMARERENYYFQVKAKTDALIASVVLPRSRPQPPN